MHSMKHGLLYLSQSQEEMVGMMEKVRLQRGTVQMWLYETSVSGKNIYLFIVITNLTRTLWSSKLHCAALGRPGTEKTQRRGKG